MHSIFAIFFSASHAVTLCIVTGRLPLLKIWLPFLASCCFTLGRSLAVLAVDVVHRTDNSQRNDEESNNAEQQVRNGGFLVE